MKHFVYLQLVLIFWNIQLYILIMRIIREFALRPIFFSSPYISTFLLTWTYSVIGLGCWVKFEYMISLQLSRYRFCFIQFDVFIMKSFKFSSLVLRQPWYVWRYHSDVQITSLHSWHNYITRVVRCKTWEFQKPTTYYFSPFIGISIFHIYWQSFDK